MSFDLIKLFEKWIQEHGSASLSKEVIDDLRQKITDSDKAHKTEIENLKVVQTQEVARLNEQHAREMAALEQQHTLAMANFQQQQPPAEPQLSKEELYMIGFMARLGGEAALPAMASGLKCSPTRAKYYADKLKRLGLIREGPHLPEGQMYALKEEGLDFAVRNGLI
jgi:hypothetical protein